MDQSPQRPLRVVSPFWRVLQTCAERAEAQLVVMDLGPNLGAINRAALIAADHVVVPLTADLSSIRGLENLGPTLKGWRRGWQERRAKEDRSWKLPLPDGAMAPIGYVVMQPRMRLDCPTRAYAKWTERIPARYRAVVGHSPADEPHVSVETDPYCLGIVKHYSSLAPRD